MLLLPKKIRIDKQKALPLFVALTLLLGSIELFTFPHNVNAAAATGYLQLDRMAASTATGGSVCINPVANETTVRQLQITFPVSGTPGTADSTHFGVNQTAANWTWDTTNIPVGTTAFPGTATTTTVSNGIVTFITTADQSLSTGTVYCLHFTGTTTLSTPTNAASNLTGSITLKDSGGTTLTNETVNYATAIISNDQISVLGSVASTFSFSLTGTSASLGTIATAANGSSATAITGTVSTNANNGWLAWVKSANAALSSSSTGGSIPSATFTTGSGNIVDLASSTGYVLDVQAGTGSPTIATEYAGNGSSSGGSLATTFKQIASKSSPVSGNTFTMAVRARATSTTKAASDYADTLTVTAAGQF